MKKKISVNNRVHGYAHEIMQVMGEASLHNGFTLTDWKKKYGKDCLYERVVKILKKALRSNPPKREGEG